MLILGLNETIDQLLAMAVLNSVVILTREDGHVFGK